ncbi:Uncharacterised protein [Legionella lansingensis]|uniref:Uncharacterized protein n=1 Tax=Legionella lansingensis TaxID=45067 RepID=A0A0W0VTM7_9GAMM|nr:hypothetical protein [Legionella lansingensis]KTD23362.1 hypothetical protein Llan_0861 [Legionella lansingensis]SNV49393.1 Uncharacterised protein [Legionella lansingensis]
MNTWIAGLIMLFFSALSYGADYKVFWRCQDDHLEAFDVYEMNDKKIDLFLNYVEDGKKEFISSPINLKSVVDLPTSFNQEDFLMLGDNKRVFMNCVGQVVLSPHYPQAKVIFDVRRNAHSCPFIPSDC